MRIPKYYVGGSVGMQWADRVRAGLNPDPHAGDRPKPKPKPKPEPKPKPVEKEKKIDLVKNLFPEIPTVEDLIKRTTVFSTPEEPTPKTTIMGEQVAPPTPTQEMAPPIVPPNPFSKFGPGGPLPPPRWTGEEGAPIYLPGFEPGGAKREMGPLSGIAGFGQGWEAEMPELDTFDRAFWEDPLDRYESRDWTRQKEFFKTLPTWGYPDKEGESQVYDYDNYTYKPGLPELTPAYPNPTKLYKEGKLPRWTEWVPPVYGQGEGDDRYDPAKGYVEDYYKRSSHMGPSPNIQVDPQSGEAYVFNPYGGGWVNLRDKYLRSGFVNKETAANAPMQYYATTLGDVDKYWNSPTGEYLGDGVYDSPARQLRMKLNFSPPAGHWYTDSPSRREFDTWLSQNIGPSLGDFMQQHFVKEHLAKTQPQEEAGASQSTTGIQALLKGAGSLNPEEWLYRGTDPAKRTAERAFAKSLTIPEALELDKKYMYDPYHPDANKALAKSQIGRAVGQLGYLGKGLLSTTGIDVGGIGGGTPGTRNIYERTLGLPAVQNIGRTIGRALPFANVGLAAADVKSRLGEQDYLGAGLGTLSAVPGPVGWLGLGGQMLADTMRGIR